MLGNLMKKHLNGKVVNNFFEKLSKANPKHLFAGGIVGIIATLFAAYKKAPLIKDAVNEMFEDMDEYDALIEEGEVNVPKVNFKKYAMRIMNHASLPILCALLSVAMFTASNQALTKQLAMVTSGHVALSKEYSSYREEIRTTHGKEADRKAYQNTQYKKQDTIEAGQKAYKIDEEIRVRTTTGGITSCMVTDLYSGIEPEQADIDFGRKYSALKLQFESQGYLLQNEVRDMFGVPRIPEGHYLGWAWGDDFELEWTPMFPVNHITGELLYDPSVDFLIDYELAWSIPTDITDEIRLGKTRA